ncbi:MAG: cell division protein FtsL [Desulfotomaculum sp.]|nr:cell division protein FtsL [Desulfotomaculum sp.]
MLLAREKLEYGAPYESVPEKQKLNEKRQSRTRVSRQAIVRKKVTLTFMVLCCFVMGIMVAYYYAQIAYLGYKIDSLERRLAELRLESHSLDQKVSKITSLQYIEAIATSELGMVKPSGRNVVLVSNSPVEEENTERAPADDERQLAQKETITLPGETQTDESSRNRFIQAFAEMVENWHS